VIFFILLYDKLIQSDRLSTASDITSDFCHYPFKHIFQHVANKYVNEAGTILIQYSFRDVRTSEIKLQLNNAAVGRLKRNKILFYFTRPHIREMIRLFVQDRNTSNTAVQYTRNTKIKIKIKIKN